MIGLDAIRAAFPERRSPVGDLAELAGATDAERAAVAGLGIDEVRDAGDVSASVLAADAATRSLAAAGLPAATGVEALLVVSPRAPDYLLASDATHVQHLAGLGGALTMSVSDLGCVSVSAAIRVAAAMLAADVGCRPILVCHGSRPTTTRRYRRPVTVSGDGGLGFLVSRDPAFALKGLLVESNGQYWDLFRVDYRGDNGLTSWTEACRDEREYSFTLAVESRRRFQDMAGRLLAAADMTLGDVDHLVIQNISSGAFAFYEQCFGRPIAPVCRDTLRSYGHLGSMDVIWNLQAGRDRGDFRPGEHVLILNNAPVAAWSTMLVEVTR